uniref:AB hydrolase-1 domain-containing protein n=1 Tax=Psilocybe cubensis TaxID=181762 RepID=A0A8H7XR93_PSICU
MKAFPDAPLLGLSFSLGANVLTRYVAEEGDRCLLRSACVLACPWDMKFNGDRLNAAILGRHLWSKGMGRNMQALIKQHKDILLSNPDSPTYKVTRRVLSMRNPALNELDNVFTAVIGGTSPPFPFEDAASYYTWASSHKCLDKIRIPFLTINASDDPVVKQVPEECSNGLVVLGLTQGGGHLGWFQSDDSFDVRWTTKPLLEWLRMSGDYLLGDHERMKSSLYVADDGFLRDAKNPRLGCKVLEVKENSLIDGNAGQQQVFRGQFL